tara:strand:+ start:624 stop:1730 length:1107 start_codon:yes stop_codon:yes gene_type:complete
MKQSKICLNAMVGSEEATIQRMLNSVVTHIDYYVIQCNGNDSTRAIIDGFFKNAGIPGFTYEIGWDYPGWNRNHTLQEALKADHGCDWILRMDADEQLVIDGDFDWDILNDTSVSSWNVVADPGNSLYFRTWMWNANLPWFFQHDKRHETIHLPEVGEDFQRISLPKSFRHVITNDGDTWLAPMKFITDGLTLELDKVPTNLVLEDNYHLWYIGKSYSDGFRDVDNLPFGKDHSDEYARRSIFYFEQYLNQQHDFKNTQYPAMADDMGYYACLLIAQGYEWIGDVDKQLFYLNIAGKFNGVRNEHYIALANYYQENKKWKLMYEITSILMMSDRTNPFPDYSFFIESLAYHDTGTRCKELHNIASSNV